MRLAFCFMSNDLRRAVGLDSTFNYTMAAPPYIIDSYTKNILINPPMILEDALLLPNWNVQWKRHNSFGATTDFFSLRQDSLSMAGNSDLIYVGDDDFLFDGASSIINECCVYLEEHQDCGAILLGANLGGEGEKHGTDIYITNNGHLNTNRGILLRNRECLMNNSFHALGALEDTIISFTCLLDGYYIARRLNVPITHTVERNTLKEDHTNRNYDLKFIKTKGIWNRVTEILGEWPDQNIWPKGIWGEYRRVAMINGFEPKYDQEGEILGG
jgi:hypothetical protein